MGILPGQVLLQLACGETVSANGDGDGVSSHFVRQSGEDLDGQFHGAPPAKLKLEGPPI
ncbi:hypothetical protein D3C76_1199840 [compost metagenome]